MKKIFLLSSVAVCLGFALQAQNVGIGTTSPTTSLHISSPSDTALLLVENRTTLANNTSTGLYFKNGSYYTGAIKTTGANSNSARLGIYTFGASSIGGLKERISILDGGNVGIGTTSPSATLHVNGTFRLEGNGAVSDAVLSSDANGNATWKAQVGFRGRLGDDWAVTPAAGEFQLIGFTSEFNDGGGFNAAAGTFTAPSAGVYQFTTTLNWSQDISNTGSTLILARLYLTRSGSNNIIEQSTNSIPNITNYSQAQTLTSIIKLSAGDVITLRVDPQASSTFYLSGNGSTATRFAGAKLY